MVRPTNSQSNKVHTLLISEGQADVSELAGQVQLIQQSINQPPTPIYQNVPQAVNQIFNGSFSHSWKSWFNTLAVDNSRYECYPWYSHPIADGQPMYLANTADGNATLNFTSADVSTGADTITFGSAHGLGTGLGVRFTTGGTLPAPLNNSTTYYVIRVSATAIQLAASATDAADGIAIDLSTTGAGTSTLSFNYTLKEAAHTLYSVLFTDWAWDTGTARPEGQTSLDTIIPGNNIAPAYTYYGVFDIVRRNAYVTCGTSERIWAGLYAKQGATWDWIGGDFEIEYDVIGTVTTPTSRDYLIYTTTDRGFTIESSVLTIANAPSDTDFANGARVLLSWKNVLRYGVQTYQIWRDTGGTIKLLQEITTGQTTYIDNGGFIASSGVFPTGTFDRLVAYTATIPNVLDTLPYSGDPLNPQWATLPFSLKVAQNYDMSTTDFSLKQWLRYGLSTKSTRLDYRIPGCVTTSGSATVTSDAGVFETFQEGLQVDITYSDGNEETSFIDTVTDPNTITLTANASQSDDNATLFIHQGAPPHSLWVDLAHLSYIQGAAFAPAAADNDPMHGIPPVVPNGSTQGGSGGSQDPGGIDGQPTCVFEDELVLVIDGQYQAPKWWQRIWRLFVKPSAPKTKEIPASQLQRGMIMSTGNQITEVMRGLDWVWYLETEMGIILRCTDTKQVYISKHRKKAVKYLKIGDIIRTEVRGVEQDDRIRTLTRIQRGVVIRLSLYPDDKFLAGSGKGRVLVSNAKPQQVPTVY